MRLTQDRVRELFDYDPETGTLTRIALPGRWCKTVQTSRRPAGYMSNQGYYNVKIDGKSYRAHRVIWLWVYGYFPEGDLDHINRVRSDNRLSNLRESSRSCNVFNSNKRTDSEVKVRGVAERRDRAGGVRYTATIGVRGVSVRQVTTEDFIEAVAHRLAAEQCLGVYELAGIDTDASSYIKEYLRACD